MGKKDRRRKKAEASDVKEEDQKWAMAAFWFAVLLVSKSR